MVDDNKYDVNKQEDDLKGLISRCIEGGGNYGKPCPYLIFDFTGQHNDWCSDADKSTFLNRWEPNGVDSQGRTLTKDVKAPVCNRGLEVEVKE